jgi:hypothetical protein
MKTEKPLKASHQVIKDYLDSLPEEQKYKECRGKAREELKERVFPFLSPDRQEKFKNNPARFNVWTTETLKKCRGVVIVPARTRKDKPLKQVGDPNTVTKEAIAVKNQKPSILASKQKYEDAHPKRMHKHHGKENKLASQKKYREAKKKRTKVEHYKKAKTMQKFSEVVIVPKHASKDNPLKQVSDCKVFTKEAIDAKKQKPCSLLFKQKCEGAHPKEYPTQKKYDEAKKVQTKWKHCEAAYNKQGSETEQEFVNFFQLDNWNPQRFSEEEITSIVSKVFEV